MRPLVFLVLACGLMYVGIIQMAFSVLMRLPLRLNAERAERHGRVEGLGYYLDDPLRLFLPAMFLQAVVVAVATAVVMLEVSFTPVTVGLVGGGLFVFLLVCGLLIPALVVRRDPERILEIFLPSFRVVARVLIPVTQPFMTLLDGWRREKVGPLEGGGAQPGVGGDGSEADRSDVDEQEERKLLQSVVEFGDTLVREVMTPRPDIVAVKSIASLSELRALFTEQQYSRFPVYRKNLDDVLGFVFVKDLVTIIVDGDVPVIERLMRPAYAVPETKRVADLLREFQQKQVQSAIVHDEYGGTAGLVTVEDLLEEIVGEIRDEYDVESEPIVDEGDGSFVFDGTVGVDDVAERLQIEIERQGFETVGGYLLSRLGRVPRVGEILTVENVDVEILEGERRRIQRVRMRRRPEGVDAGH